MDFDSLKDAFKKFTDKHSGEDLRLRAGRTLAAGVKGAVDQGRTEFSKEFIVEYLTDLYATIASPEMAEGISTAVRSFDQEKVKDLLDALVAALQDEKISADIGKALKQLADKTTAEELIEKAQDMMQDRPAMEQMSVIAAIAELAPHIEDLKNGTEEDAAQKVRELAMMIPVDALAAQAGAITDSVTPDVVAKATADVVSKLPAPEAVADTAGAASKVASDKLGDMTKAKNTGELSQHFNDMVAGIGRVIEEAVNKAQPGKTKPSSKKGRSHNL